MKIKLLNENAKVPTRSNPTDAGLDLYSCENITVYPRSVTTVKTGISVEFPDTTKDKEVIDFAEGNYYGRVAPRSGMAAKYGIDVFAGVVDNSYRGEICVVLYNSSDEFFRVSSGDRIAQLIIEKHYNLPVEVVENLSETDRGDKGFGSSGQ